MPSNSSQQTAGRIVVVGVEPPEVQELETILRFDGFDVTCAPTGAAALRRTQNLPVDLILIGTNSFKTNEVEEFRRFKQDARTCSVPMLFICDELDGKSKTKGFAAGCVDTHRAEGRGRASCDPLDGSIIHPIDGLGHPQQILPRWRSGGGVSLTDLHLKQTTGCVWSELDKAGVEY